MSLSFSAMASDSSNSSESAMIMDRAEDLIEDLEKQMKKCKQLKKSKSKVCLCTKCHKLRHLIDDLEFLGSIDDECLNETSEVKPLFYSDVELLDMDTPLTLPDMTIIPFSNLLQENALLYKFLEYRKLDRPYYNVEHYFEWAPYFNKLSIVEEKLPVIQLILGLDAHLMATGETLATEIKRKNEEIRQKFDNESRGQSPSSRVSSIATHN